ncbi:MAG: VWA domain-containing protein [Gammaproteobacteria bacterium]|nr:VWA domain-containing protein [Gammaproteobacteria bacterium]
MKSKLLILALFAATAVAVGFYPMVNNTNSNQSSNTVVQPENLLSDQKPKIEVVFVLDTTGSMGGLIDAAKEKIWSIASNMASAQPAPEIKMGLVAYRDRGDDYVTRVVDLSNDLDSMYATLMDFQAGGGGDGPESVNQAVYDAVHKVSWSQNKDSYKVIFLVGDAPPHMDYQDDVKYPVSVAAAKQKGIVVNAIRCGGDSDTQREWLRVAQLGNGQFFNVEQTGSAVAMTTPYDEKIAKLSEELDDTRLFYGTKKELARKAAKVAATDKLTAGASMESRARRGVFNASKSGAANLIGDKELVDEISSGRVDLNDIAEEELPAPIQAMAPAERLKVVKEKSVKRDQLMKEIATLGQQRQEYMKEKVKEAGGAKDSLDVQLYEAIKEQAAEKGLVYSDEAIAY